MNKQTIAGRFKVATDEGKVYEVVKLQDLLNAGDSFKKGEYELRTVKERYHLNDVEGEPDTYQIVETDEIVRKL